MSEWLVTFKDGRLGRSGQGHEDLDARGGVGHSIAKERDVREGDAREKENR